MIDILCAHTSNHGGGEGLHSECRKIHILIIYSKEVDNSTLTDVWDKYLLRVIRG